MDKEKEFIPANDDEIKLSTYTGEALWKIQTVEQVLSCLITLKLNPDAKMEQADTFLKSLQSYTLGQAINEAKDKDCLKVLFKRNCIHSEMIEIG